MIPARAILSNSANTWRRLRRAVPRKSDRGGRPAVRAPLREGQKSGWFYDQSGNRRRLTHYLPPGARVLDVCSYVGAWAITALRHGAAAARCVDSSALALDFAARNARANAVQLEILRADAFEALRQLREAGERFDVVILDPPAFIKRKKDIPQGIAAYRKLNQLALNLIEATACSYPARVRIISRRMSL